MKTSLCAILLSTFFALPVLGQVVGVGEVRVPVAEMREWTNHLGKKITGKIVEKSEDDSRVKLLLANGKETWVNTDDLIGEDLKVVMAWEKLPEGFEFIKVEDTTKGPLGGFVAKRVTFQAGALPLNVEMKWSKDRFRREVIPAGETKVFVTPMTRDGWVAAFTADGTKVAEWLPDGVPAVAKEAH